MYNIENPIGKAMGGMSQAGGTFGSMQKDTKVEKPDPTVGGGAMAGMGGAVTAATLAGTEMGAAAMTAINGSGTSTSASYVNRMEGESWQGKILRAWIA